MNSAIQIQNYIYLGDSIVYPHPVNGQNYLLNDFEQCYFDGNIEGQSYAPEYTLNQYETMSNEPSISTISRSILSLNQIPQCSINRSIPQQNLINDNEIDWNNKNQLEHYEYFVKQNEKDEKILKKKLDIIRKSKQKINRTRLTSFCIKILNDFGYHFKIENPKKLSQKTFCLMIEEMYHKDEMLENIEGIYWTIKQIHGNEKRCDIRECAMVLIVNMLLFLIEECGGIVTYGKEKKSGKYLLFTTENVESISINGKVYKYKECIDEGDWYFENIIRKNLGKII